MYLHLYTKCCFRRYSRLFLFGSWMNQHPKFATIRQMWATSTTMRNHIHTTRKRRTHNHNCNRIWFTKNWVSHIGQLKNHTELLHTSQFVNLNNNSQYYNLCRIQMICVTLIRFDWIHFVMMWCCDVRFTYGQCVVDFAKCDRFIVTMW